MYSGQMALRLMAVVQNGPFIVLTASTDSNLDLDPLNFSDSETQPLCAEAEEPFIDIPTELRLNTPDSLLKVFMAEHLAVGISDQSHWTLQCPDCDKWCQTSVSSDIPLFAPGQFKAFSNHQGSKKCLHAAAVKRQTVSSNMPDGNEALASQPIPSDHQLSYSTSPYPVTTICTGIPVLWLEDLRPFVMLFPWERYHDGPNALPSLVDSMRALPADPQSHTNYKFLGLGHMQNIARGYADQMKQLKLQASNESCKYMRYGLHIQGLSSANLAAAGSHI
ncbi:hypothetical protein BDR06DRAFT_971579 [Suillus hirtellus]|nr:hypothetical protein BDR06DRAFT_971579 [Suillus hirtellus]